MVARSGKKGTRRPGPRRKKAPRPPAEAPAPAPSPHSLRVRVSGPAMRLLEAIVGFERDPVNKRENAFFRLEESQVKAAEELVDRGLAFYSMDREHVGLARHLPEVYASQGAEDRG